MKSKTAQLSMTDDLNLTHTKFNLETRAIQNTARLVERPRRGDGEGERVQERGVRLGEVLEAGPARAQEPADGVVQYRLLGFEIYVSTSGTV